MIFVKTRSYEETIEFGKKLGGILAPNDLICLSGDLGTGKTALTQGIAKSLGINSYITSPTFTIVNEHQGKYPLFHFDVYRIADPDEMFDIGFEEYLSSEGVSVIEWGELIRDILPHDIININVKKALEESLDTRLIEVDFVGDRYSNYQKRLEEILKNS